MEHYYLQLWLWGCISDGEAFLQADAEFIAIMHQLLKYPSHLEAMESQRLARRRLDLAKYHFATTMGSLLRHLNATHSMFPEIQAAYNKAEHLRKEGKNLRDMIEHADEYLAGGGRKQKEFVREAEGVAANLPGDQPGRSDATAMIVDGNGHLLGGRLNVERVLSEVREIWAVAEKLPAPRTE